jgi:hypothetical protein
MGKLHLKTQSISTSLDEKKLNAGNKVKTNSKNFFELSRKKRERINMDGRVQL